MSLVREGAGCEFLPVSLSTHPAGQEKTDPEGKTEGSTALSIVVWGGGRDTLRGGSRTHQIRRGHRAPCAGGPGAFQERAERAGAVRKRWGRSGRRTRTPRRAARTRRARCPRAPPRRRGSRTPSRGRSARLPGPRSSRPRRPGSARSSRTRRAPGCRARGSARARDSARAGTDHSRGAGRPRRGARGPGPAAAAAGAARARVSVASSAAGRQRRLCFALPTAREAPPLRPAAADWPGPHRGAPPTAGRPGPVRRGGPWPLRVPEILGRRRGRDLPEVAM